MLRMHAEGDFRETPGCALGLYETEIIGICITTSEVELQSSGAPTLRFVVVAFPCNFFYDTNRFDSTWFRNG